MFQNISLIAVKLIHHSQTLTITTLQQRSIYIIKEREHSQTRINIEEIKSNYLKNKRKSEAKA